MPRHAGKNTRERFQSLMLQKPVWWHFTKPLLKVSNFIRSNGLKLITILKHNLQDIQVYIQANVPRLSLPKVLSQNVINPIELLTNHQENLYVPYTYCIIFNSVIHIILHEKTLMLITRKWFKINFTTFKNNKNCTEQRSGQYHNIK